MILTCLVCDRDINMMCFKGTGVCSEQCRKAFTWEDGPR